MKDLFMKVICIALLGLIPLNLGVVSLVPVEADDGWNSEGDDIT